MKSDTFSVNNSDIISGFIVVSCIFETEVLQAYTCDSIKKGLLSRLSFQPEFPRGQFQLLSL